jgi:hypothetical protein
MGFMESMSGGTGSLPPLLLSLFSCGWLSERTSISLRFRPFLKICPVPSRFGCVDLLITVVRRNYGS